MKRVRKEDNSLKEALAASFQPTGKLVTSATGAEELGKNEGQGTLKKTTISFHQDEQRQIDLILDALLRCRRHRGGFSDAVKIALRLCPLDESKLGLAWDEARQQDRRTKKNKLA